MPGGVRRLIVLACTALLAPGVARAQPVDPAAPPLPTSGIRVGVTPGAMFSVTSGQDATAYGSDLWLGYELMHGRVGITPYLDAGFESFTGSHSGQLLFAMPSVKLGFHTGGWVPALMFGLGYARTWAGTGGVESATANYLALSFGAELVHQLVPNFAIGIAVHYKPFVDPAVNSFVDFGVSAIVSL
jgi:hypothetical protein